MVLLSPNLEGFLVDVKRAALEAVLAAKPFSFTYGTVESVSPLQITVDQKLTLYAGQLILTHAVRDYTVEMTVEHTTEAALTDVDTAHEHDYSGTTEAAETDEHSHDYSGNTENAGGVNLAHSHAYTGRKRFTVHLALQKGEKVLLLRADGGRKYIVLDRAEVPT